MKYIEEHTELNTDDNKAKESIIFNKNGQQTKLADKQKIYAKLLVKNQRESYYIRVHQSVPYDPMGTYGKRSAWIETKMQPVSKSTFDFYMMYLQTKNSLYMTRARRGLTND